MYIVCLIVFPIIAYYVCRSLSALGDVLGALAEGRGHIPYRNSRLTHMLQDAIGMHDYHFCDVSELISVYASGGDAKMLLVVTVSPGIYCQRDTLHSLKFGVRARQVARGAAKKRILQMPVIPPTYPGPPFPSSASAPNLSLNGKGKNENGKTEIGVEKKKPSQTQPVQLPKPTTKTRGGTTASLSNSTKLQQKKIGL
jgi:hypothetical protein